MARSASEPEVVNSQQPSTHPSAWPWGKGAMAVAALGWWAARDTASQPRIWSADGLLKQKVLPLCTLLHQPYKPSPWAINTHAQSVLGFMRGASLLASYTRQLIMAHDGGTLGLDWFGGSDKWDFAPMNAPVLLILHGINGGSHEGYCKWMCAAAVKNGWRAAVLNYRGCNGLELTSPRGYAATLTHDIHYAITSIKARFPAAPLSAVGYSLGGVFLTKYLAEADSGLHASVAALTSAFEPFEGSGLVAACVVSSPVCLFNSSANLAVPWTTSYVYNILLAYKMREYMKEHQVNIREHSSFDVDKALMQWTVGGIEDVGVPTTFGFANRQEYYEAASSLQHIPAIKTPTLFLMSLDDPFLGVLPDVECEANPNTVLAATKTGGHLGFLQGWWPFGTSYMDGVVMEWCTTVMRNLPPASLPRPREIPFHGLVPLPFPADPSHHDVEGGEHKRQQPAAEPVSELRQWLNTDMLFNAVTEALVGGTDNPMTQTHSADTMETSQGGNSSQVEGHSENNQVEGHADSTHVEGHSDSSQVQGHSDSTQAQHMSETSWTDRPSHSGEEAVEPDPHSVESSSVAQGGEGCSGQGGQEWSSHSVSMATNQCSRGSHKVTVPELQAAPASCPEASATPVGMTRAHDEQRVHFPEEHSVRPLMSKL